MSSGSSSTVATVLGGVLAATGAAHFVVPDAFAPITSAAFPTDTRAWTFRNGATELVIGTAIAVPKTRRIGLVGLAAYVGFLGYRGYQAR